MSDDRLMNVLFLCRKNSARSLFAECVLAREGRGRFSAFSAGSAPADAPNEHALEELQKNNFLVDELRSKSWDEFTGPDAPEMDFVFTLCDEAANEACPVWPGTPMTAHWSIADPAVAAGNPLEQRRAYVRAFAEVKNRVSIFVNLPFESLDRLKLQAQLDAIGGSIDVGAEEAPA